MKYYLSALKKYAVFQGRASRREFWMFYLFNVIFMLLAVVLDFMLGTTIQSNGVILSLFSTGYFSTGYYLALLIPTVSIGVRRLHDVGKNGWIIVILYILVFLYPILRALTGRWIVLDIIAFIFNIYIIIAGIYIFVLLVSPGETKDNKFGLSPIKAQLVNDVSRPEETKIGETQRLIPEDKKIGNVEQLKKQENAEELIKAYDKVLSLNPNDAHAWFNKGLTLGNLGSFQEAIECYDEAIRINPNNADAWNNKGVAFANIGKFNEAQECFDKAKEINQKNNEYSH